MTSRKSLLIVLLLVCMALHTGRTHGSVLAGSAAIRMPKPPKVCSSKQAVAVASCLCYLIVTSKARVKSQKKAIRICIQLFTKKSVILRRKKFCKNYTKKGKVQKGLLVKIANNLRVKCLPGTPKIVLL